MQIIEGGSKAGMLGIGQDMLKNEGFKAL